MREVDVDTAPLRSPAIPELSVVMPALNEEEAITFTLFEAVNALDAVARCWELIVVDDGSSDGTAEVVERWSSRDGRIGLLRQPAQLGYGSAVRRGFEAARFLVVCTVDADNQYDLRDLAELFGLLREAHVVAGYRLQHRGGWRQRITSAACNLAAAGFLGVRARDVSCTMRLFRSSFLQLVDLESEGFAIGAELLARAQRAGLAWRQAGVVHRRREHGSAIVRPGVDGGVLRELIRLRRSL